MLHVLPLSSPSGGIVLCFRPGVLPGQLEHHEQEERQLKLETLSLAMVLGNSIPTTPTERLLACIGMPKTTNQTMDPRVVVPSWLISGASLRSSCDSGGIRTPSCRCTPRSHPRLHCRHLHHLHRRRPPRLSHTRSPASSSAHLLSRLLAPVECWPAPCL